METTNETKHTPGDWYYEPADDGDPSVGMSGYAATICTTRPDDPDGDPIVIATIHAPHYHETPTDAEDDGFRMLGDGGANGLLMAAAPKLLAALEEIERHHVENNRAVGRSEANSHTLTVARAAIAKARGETSHA